MYTVEDHILRALLRSHEMVCQVDVFDDDGLRAANVPIINGNITATLLSDVCRTGTLVVSKKLLDAGLFDPYWDKVRISTGVQGLPLIPIFTGRVGDLTIRDGASVTVPLDDFGEDIIGADFEKPWVVRRNRSVLAEMRRIIQDVSPDFTVDTTGTPDGKTPDVSWNGNRGNGLDELATGINAIWQSTRTGGFVVYPNPYDLGVPPKAVVTLTDGDGGSLINFEEVRSRSEVYNSITVEVQRADGGAPIRVTVRDNRASSKTRWGGKFGKRNRRISLQTPIDESGARQIARRILGQSLALARSWRFSTPHFPLLDPGDVVAVSVDGEIRAHVIESVNYPLLALNETQFTSRELRQYAEEVEDSSTGYWQGFIDPQEPVTPTPPTTPFLLGMSAPNGQPTQQIVAEYAPQYMRDFGSDGGDADSLPELGNINTGKWFDAPNVLMHTSWKDDVTQLSTWLDTLDRDIYISWYHEPEGDVDPAVFRSTCEQMVAIIDAHPNKARVLGNGPITTRYWLQEGSNGNPTDWGYTGMTFYGIDFYNQSTSSYWGVEQMFVPALTKVRSAYPGIKIIIPEYGFIRTNADTTGTGRAAMLKTHIRWLRTQSDILACAYFNATGSIPGVPFTATSPEGQAWKELMAEQGVAINE